MGMPIPGSKVRSDSQKVKFLMIFGRPKTGFLAKFPGPRGTFPQFPLATNHAVLGLLGSCQLRACPEKYLWSLPVVLP